MGVSRADLWAFASLIALDDFLSKTETRCGKSQVIDQMCGFPCMHTKPRKDILKLFKTGRMDCKAKDGAYKKHQYLTERKESHPNKHQSGEPTIKYFKDNFNLDPRESLALMGVHTIAQFNGMTSHLNYGWTSAATVKVFLFNNEYYRNLGEFDNCNGDGMKLHKITTGP